MKALYRKYRPTRLSDVIGQPQITDLLAHALKTGRFSHAYLFTGPRGCGKTSVARIFAHEINGFNYQLEDSYVDIIEIDAASNTGVDNIRDLREKAVIAPSEGKYKIYIIDEVHMLSKSAFNALLKTLEEPPEHVIFIMATTDAYKVPVTITSRSQVFEFQLASPEVMQKHLAEIAQKEGIKIADDALKIIVRRGGGSFRDSISLLDQISTLKEGEISAEDVTSALGLPADEQVQQLLTAYLSQNLTEISGILKTILNSGTKPETLAEEIITQILTNPKPELLPLLKTLPEVSAPFPEAKILLAFCGNQVTSAPTLNMAPNPARMASAPVSSNPIATTSAPPVAKTPPEPQNPVSEAPKPPETTPEAPEPQTPSIAQVQAKAPSDSPETPQNASSAKDPAENTSETPVKPPESSQTGTQSFSWDAYIENVRSSSPTVADILTKSQVVQEQNRLTIFPMKKVFCSVLNRKNNQDVLTKHLPAGLELVIKNPDEIPPSSAQFSAISDIMGTVQEVKTDDSPF